MNAPAFTEWMSVNWYLLGLIVSLGWFTGSWIVSAVQSAVNRPRRTPAE
jgi:hypothetical protein